MKHDYIIISSRRINTYSLHAFKKYLDRRVGRNGTERLETDGTSGAGGNGAERVEMG